MNTTRRTAPSWKTELSQAVSRLLSEIDDACRGGHKERVLRPRSKRSFVQSFTLLSTLDEQDVRADLHDGVLSVTVAKKPESRARSISK